MRPIALFLLMMTAFGCARTRTVAWSPSPNDLRFETAPSDAFRYAIAQDGANLVVSVTFSANRYLAHALEYGFTLRFDTPALDQALALTYPVGTVQVLESSPLQRNAYLTDPSWAGQPGNARLLAAIENERAERVRIMRRFSKADPVDAGETTAGLLASQGLRLSMDRDNAPLTLLIRIPWESDRGNPFGLDVEKGSAIRLRFEIRPPSYAELTGRDDVAMDPSRGGTDRIGRSGSRTPYGRTGTGEDELSLALREQMRGSFQFDVKFRRP